MKINCFKAWRPAAGLADKIATLPYDVMDRNQAAEMADGNPLSFLRVTRSEIELPESANPYDASVYDLAKKNLEKLKAEGSLVREAQPTLYLYSQEMDGRIQYGVVALCNVADYEAGNIKIHEKTRRAKEDDRTRHVDLTNCHSGPIFLTYRDNAAITASMQKTAQTAPLYRITAAGGIIHTVWKIADSSAVQAAFESVPAFYVADGHHRAASAARVAQMRRRANPAHTGDESYNWFLCVLFPAGQLKILPYNRVVFDLNGQTQEEFFHGLEREFVLTATDKKIPDAPGAVCMYIDYKWYLLTPKKELPTDPVASLDVSVLQDRVLAPLLGIDDPRESNRIDFIGGIHGTPELERRVNAGEAIVAFSLYPTTLGQLLAVADASQLMPPKSTW
ncbi:MAG: DUF1015 domain-containing protein, partial [Kiritimatiellaceae bacterium]|nr:DUF1015 domain-containing protein [Kiritimatiellaceae bacterium]